MSKALTKKGASELTKSSPATIIVRILGATMDSQIKILIKILKENESDDAVVFCVLSGIFSVIANDEESTLKDLFGVGYHEDAIKELDAQVERFTEILTKNKYNDYPIAVMPEEKIKKEDFWIDVWGKLFLKTLDEAFVKQDYKNQVFMRANLVNKVLFIASQYSLFDKDLFYKKHLKKAIYEKIDDYYVRELSNSVNKIWDAGRAAWEYFIRKIVLFNPSIPDSVKKDIEKRWRVWFLLEDNYKQTQRGVKRKELLKELEASLKIV
jgi:hypothetical protein